MNDYVFFKDLDGKYLGCNREYEKLLGKTEAEIIGKTAYDFNDTELADIYTTSDQAVIKTKNKINLKCG